jgi:23S rRNA-/tRNA-specific pseudouridylate synthase
MKYLSDTIKERRVEKYYIAIVYGMVKDRDIAIESYIGRDKHNRQKMTTQNPVNPKLATTKIQLIDYIDNKYSLLRVKLETGRTHQIRVHLASIGFPIIGDSVYGNSKANTEAKTRYQIKRQALHACSLEFELYGKIKKFE